MVVSSSSSHRCSTTSRTIARCSSPMRFEHLATDGQLMAYRHEQFWQWHGHAPRHASPRRDVAERPRRLESLVVSAFWRDRPTFVTGATGLVGSWLVGRLVDANAEVVCLIRDRVPQSELVRSGLSERVTGGPRWT